MADPFLGEIRMFAGTFAPSGWALCNGQTLPLQQNTALFSLLGTSYGGDGKSTFALPNLQGATPLGFGQGPGLSARSQGETGGVAAVTLQTAEIPAHTHTARAAATPGSEPAPGAASVWAPAGAARGERMYTRQPATVTMSGTAIAAAGGSQPHNNRPPYLGVTFIIALQGVYPPRD